MTAPPPTIPAIDYDRYSKLLLKVEQLAHRHGWDGPVHLRVVLDEALAGPDVVNFFRRINVSHPRYASVRHDGYVAATLFNHRVLYRRWQDIPEDLAAELREADPHSVIGPGPWATLRRLVMNTAYGGGDELAEQMREILRAPGLLGFVTVTEAWRNHGEAVLRAARGEVHLGDVPGSIETRVLYSVDLTRRVQRVERVRGRKPEVVRSVARDLIDEAFADLPRDMRRAVARWPLPKVPEPEPTIDADALLRGDFTTSMRILCDTVLDRLPQTPEDFAARYPTLLACVEARCSDPGDPDSCPDEPHAHDPRDYLLIDGRWRRRSDR